MITIKYDSTDWDDWYFNFSDDKRWRLKSLIQTKRLMMMDVEDHFMKRQGPKAKWMPHTMDYTTWLLRNRGGTNPLLRQSGALFMGVRNQMRIKQKATGGFDRVYLEYKSGKRKDWAHLHNNPEGFWVKKPYGNPNIGKRWVAGRQFGWLSIKATDEIKKVWTQIR
jgi:hypothetical protein